MASTNAAGGRPDLGMNRPTVFLAAWLFVGVSLTGLAILDVMNRGYGEAWIFLFGGVFLLGYMIRDWLRQERSEFVTRNDDVAFIGLTLFAIAITLWVLLGRFVI